VRGRGRGRTRRGGGGGRALLTTPLLAGSGCRPVETGLAGLGWVAGRLGWPGLDTTLVPGWSGLRRQTVRVLVLRLLVHHVEAMGLRLEHDGLPGLARHVAQAVRPAVRVDDVGGLLLAGLVVGVAGVARHRPASILARGEGWSVLRQLHLLLLLLRTWLGAAGPGLTRLLELLAGLLSHQVVLHLDPLQRVVDGVDVVGLHHPRVDVLVLGLLPARPLLLGLLEVLRRAGAAGLGPGLEGGVARPGLGVVAARAGGLLVGAVAVRHVGRSASRVQRDAPLLSHPSVSSICTHGLPGLRVNSFVAEDVPVVPSSPGRVSLTSLPHTLWLCMAGMTRLGLCILLVGRRPGRREGAAGNSVLTEGKPTLVLLISPTLL